MEITAAIRNSLRKALELKKSGKLAEAESLLRQLLEKQPDLVEARHHLGNTLVAGGRLKEGLRELRRAFRETPDNPILAYNLGLAFYLNLDYTQALKVFSRAVQLDPEMADGWINLGLAHHASGQFKEALAAYDRALKLAPEEPEAHWNQALTLLTMGRYREGFAAYEWRWRRNLKTRTYPHSYSQPRWRGESFSGKRLLVFSEQGFGDCLQFARFLPEARKAGGKIIFEVRPELMRLLQGLPGCDYLVPFSFSTPCREGFDLQLPLLSLPRVLGTEISRLPPPIHFPALAASESSPEKKAADRLRIGICRAGAPTHVNDHNRSLPGKYLSPLFSGLEQKISFFNLGKGAQNKTRGKNEAGITGLEDPTTNWRDFYDAALFIRGLDLVISVDTAIAHLAACLDRPVWLLLPFVPDWRWQRGTETSPWYPGIKIFRQPAPGDWATVIAQVRHQLEIHTASILSLQTVRRHEEGEFEHTATLARQPKFTAGQSRPHNPAPGPFWYELGRALHKRKKLDAAAGCYHRALELMPDETAVLCAIGDLERDRNNLEQAANYYRRAGYTIDEQL